ncbi:MAG: FkbM family methyltransferase [Nostocaceae cyanobacterium]|nr:FkbM family methyltransferase [Nostocaceae cyanobacterium]
MFKVFNPYIVRILGPKLICKVKQVIGRQSFDEVRLIYEIFKRSDICGTMVDVGAHFGSSLGLFATDGWEIVAFEPDNKNRTYLSLAHGHRHNITIDSRAVSNKPESGVPFFASNVSSGISGLSEFHESHYQQQTVDVTTLAEAALRYDLQTIDFLKIDTEGHDLFVLQGLDWEKFLPNCIVCEFENYKTEPHGYTTNDLYKYLSVRGYEVIISEWYPISEYGTAHKWRCFTDKITDLNPSAWGNMIAFQPQSPFNTLSVDKLTKLKQEIFS